MPNKGAVCLASDDRNEMTEAFRVHISMDENMIVEVQVGIMGLIKMAMRGGW